jgi:hypothetical protein
MTSGRRVGECLFCGQTGELTDEDLISKWANKARTERSGRAPKIAYSSRRVDGDVIIPLEQKLRQTYSVIRVPDVCATCNRGWMSRIDKTASEIVKRLLPGHRVGLPVRDQEALARWLALKTLIADRADDEYCVFGPEDFHAFYKARQPPDRFAATLAHMDTGGKDVSYFCMSPLRDYERLTRSTESRPTSPSRSTTASPSDPCTSTPP